MSNEFVTHGAFSWHELMTTDVAAAKRFYRELFNWDTETAPMPGTDYVVIKVAGNSVGGMMALPPEMKGMPPSWSLYITVKDVDATARKVTELGGRILRPPQDIPKVGRFCVLQDPQGAVLCAITYAEM